MVDVTYQKKFLRINQIWYSGDVSISELTRQKRRADILFVHGASVKETKGSFRGWQDFHTCINDLTLPEEKIYTAIHKNVRYECRRSERDGIEIRFYDKSDVEKDNTLLDKFAEIYESMYQSKGIDTKYNLTAVRQYLKKDGILFSTVWHGDEMLVFHSYIYDNADARLLHSASCFREESAADQNMIGRANKRLHWEDILYFKQRGIKRYDWGGISDFENPNGIDAFKLKFGGNKLTYYNVFVGNTLLGKLAVTAMKKMKRVN